MFIQKLMDYFPFCFPLHLLFLSSLTSYYVESGAMQITFITETLWDDSHNQNVAIDGCKLFRGDRRGGRGGGIALYIEGEWIVKSHPWRMAMSRSKAYGWEFETEATKGALWLVSTTGHLIKRSLLIKPSSFNYRRCHVCWLSSCWRTSTTLTSAGEVPWQAVDNPGESWNV